MYSNPSKEINGAEKKESTPPERRIHRSPPTPCARTTREFDELKAMAKKMILVDPRMMERTIATPPLIDPLAKSISELDQEIRQVLETEGVSDHEKMQRYQQTLQRYLTRTDQYRGRPLGRMEMVHPKQRPEKTPNMEMGEQESTQGADPVSKMEKRVLEAVPKTMRRKTKLLLDHMKEVSDISWNDQGEITVGGQTLKGSNLIDLVNDVLRHRKHREDPYGWEVFAKALKRANVPRELIGHTRRWEWMGTGGERPSALTTRRSAKPFEREARTRQGAKRDSGGWLKAERGWESF